MTAATVSPGPALSIWKWALAIGVPLFVAGYFGPLLFSRSNTGPLLGILITGPVGALIGGGVGAVLWAKRAPDLRVASLAKALGVVWLATLLYTLWAFALSTRIAVPGILAQAFVAGVCAFILNGRRLPKVAASCGPIVLGVMVTMVVMSLFPPVTLPWWDADALARDPASLPLVAFVLDSGFDSGRHVPLYAVNKRALVLEWLAVVALGALLCVIVARRQERP